MESTKTLQSALTFVLVAIRPALTVMAQITTTAQPVLVPLRLTLTLASVQVPSTSQEVAVIPAIQGATAVQALETLTAMLASSEETLPMGVNVTPKSTMTEVLVLAATAIVQSAQGQAIPSAQLVTLERF